MNSATAVNNDFNLGDFWSTTSDGNFKHEEQGQGHLRKFNTSNGIANVHFYDSTVGGKFPHEEKNDIHDVDTVNDGTNFQIRLRNENGPGWTVASIEFSNETDFQNYCEAIGL